MLMVYIALITRWRRAGLKSSAHGARFEGMFLGLAQAVEQSQGLTIRFQYRPVVGNATET